MTTIRLALRGLWYRRRTATVVLALAVVAAAAAAVAPLYARSAEDSIVRSTLTDAGPARLALRVSVPASGPGTVTPRGPKAPLSMLRGVLLSPAWGQPVVAYQADVVLHPVVGPVAGGLVLGRVVERAAACAHLRLTAGRCPRGPAEGLVSGRSAALLGTKVGQSLIVDLPPATRRGRAGPVRIVGTYDPPDTEDRYWMGRVYFDHALATSSFGLEPGPPRADSILVGGGAHRRYRLATYGIDVPIDPIRPGLDDTSALAAEAASAVQAMSAMQLGAVTGVQQAVAEADHGRDIVRVASPLAVAQLVLLTWWTLFLMVAATTEERGPELGLAKLRGHRPGAAARFGLTEVVVLLVVAAPAGTVLGYLLLRWVAASFFAPGTTVAPTSALLVAQLLGLAGGLAAVAAAARGVVRRPVVDLLRRVPAEHGRRRAGLVDGVVVALAAAGLLQLVASRGGKPGPVALLGPGMVGVAAGLLAARVLVRVARRHLGRAAAAGHVARLVGWAGPARRPAARRTAAVLAVATCLLLVGTQAWAVAARDRRERGLAETGAAVVLRVRGAPAARLLSQVRAADPAGRYAMAAVVLHGQEGAPDVLAADGQRIDEVASWGAAQERPAGGARHSLLPPLPAPISVGAGALLVRADTRRLDTPSPLHLQALLDTGSDPGRGPGRDPGRVEIPLGALAVGDRTYTGRLPAACAGGCRLAALVLRHAVTDLPVAEASTDLVSLAWRRAGGAVVLATRFADGRSWHAGPTRSGAATVELVPGPRLRVTVAVAGGVAAEVVHGDAPDPLPVLAGPRVAPTEGVSDGPALAGGAEVTYRVLARTGFVPRLGGNAVTVDLGLALRPAPLAGNGDAQVWLSRDDPAAERVLRARLGTAGIGVTGRDVAETRADGYAGDGAVLALRLLLLCGAAAVAVAVGALLVSAYVGTGQRAYEVAALRAVGVRRRSVLASLACEHAATASVALVVGTAGAVAAAWAVLPVVPVFDTASEMIAPRSALALVAGALTVAALAVLLVAVAVLTALLQLRAGRAGRLREGVR